MRRKVFFIGFNRTATTSLHYLFKKAGYNSCHCLKNEGGHIARQMQQNIDAEKPILYTMEDVEVFSDVCYTKNSQHIEGTHFFKRYYAEYPDAYFILNTRDTKTWIKSRTKHKRGDYLRRYMKFHNIKSPMEVKEQWEEEKEKWETKIRNFFTTAATDARFLEFHIVNDNIQTLIDFVKEDYPNLLKRDFGHKNKTPV